MKCAYPTCVGTVTELLCSLHGKLCSHCGIPCDHTNVEKRCRRCDARLRGLKCAGCGSPWVYLIFYEDEKWRCKPCVSQIIEAHGWEDSEEQVKEWLLTAEEKYKLDMVAHHEKQAQIAEQVQKATSRKKGKQEEGLFVLEDAKKKRAK